MRANVRIFCFAYVSSVVGSGTTLSDVSKIDAPCLSCLVLCDFLAKTKDKDLETHTCFTIHVLFCVCMCSESCDSRLLHACIMPSWNRIRKLSHVQFLCEGECHGLLLWMQLGFKAYQQYEVSYRIYLPTYPTYLPIYRWISFYAIP